MKDFFNCSTWLLHKSTSPKSRIHWLLLWSKKIKLGRSCISNSIAAEHKCSYLSCLTCVKFVNYLCFSSPSLYSSVLHERGPCAERERDAKL